MLQLEGRLPALIIDPDSSFLEAIKTDPVSSLAPPRLASNAEEARRLLTESRMRFVGIFVNPRISEPGGLAVLRCAHQHHAGTPIFLLCESETPFSNSELRRLAVQNTIKKPATYSEILALVAPILPSFNPSAALAIAAQNSDPLQQELIIEDDVFSPIHIDQFLSGHTSFFDVYVRLKGGRYIKILQAGDSFSEERITSYLSKGVKAFFIRKDTREQYISYCDTLATALLESNKAPIGLKVSQVLNAGDETLRFLMNRGLNADRIKFAAKFARNIKRLVEELRLGSNPAIQDHLKDASVFDHAIGAGLIGGLLLPELKMDFERVQLNLGLAILLHDVGLAADAIHLEDKDPETMTVVEKRIYYAHPRVGARILASMPGIDGAVVQAIEQHHERRDGKGFPRQQQAGQINLLSEIVGISDEFARLIRQAANDPAIRPLAVMEAKALSGFSFMVGQAFENLFRTRSRSPS